MKPDWDKLMTAFKDHASTLVADVDCTADGKSLCDKVGVRGYPTIKSGDPSNLDDYKGGRDFSALKKHAEGLMPSCSPANLGLCDAESKANIESLMALPAAELDSKIAEKDAELEAAEKKFKSEVDKLQKKYQELQEEEEATAEAVKQSGLSLMKAVKAHASKAKSEL